MSAMARKTNAALVPLIVADVFQLAGAFRSRGEAVAKRVGQTQARWQVLSAASAGPQTVPEIARRLGVSRQAVQRLADALVDDGSATFALNAEHRGSPHLVLTLQGRAALAQLSALAAGFHTDLAAQFRTGTLPALYEGLKTLIEAVDRLDQAQMASWSASSQQR